MIKIALLGCDSTHTEEFAERINFCGSPFFKNAKVVSIYGDLLAQAIIKAKKLGIERVASSIEEALEDIDLAMVIGRFGDSHYTPVLKSINAGIPVFVDKPFTSDFSQALDLVRITKKKNILLTSCSPLRFANEISNCKQFISKIEENLLTIIVSVPANCTDLGSDPRFNSPFFYGIHGIEILLELIGYNVKVLYNKYDGTSIITRIERVDKKIFEFKMIRNASEFYWIDIHSRMESYHTSILLNGSYYINEINYILNHFLLGKDLIPLESTLKAISILEDIEKGDIINIK